MLSSFRHLVAGVLVLVAAAGIVAGLTAQRSHDELLLSANFAQSARRALGEEGVREALADVLTDELVPSLPAPGRELVRRVAVRVVATDTFEDVFAAAVEDAHASVLDHPGGEVVLDLSDSAEVVRDELAEVVPAAGLVPVGALTIKVGSGTQLPDLSRMDDGVEAVAGLGLLTGVVALAAALVISPSPWGAVAATGLFVAVGSGLVWVLAAVGPELALTRLPDTDLRTVADAVIAQAVDGVQFQAGAVALIGAAAGAVGLALALRPRRALMV